MTMDHCIQLSKGYYKPEIVGALNQPKVEMYSLEQFHKWCRVAKRFFEPFQIAYDSIVSKGRSVTNIVATADNAPADEDDNEPLQQLITSDVAEQKKKKAFKGRKKKRLVPSSNVAKLLHDKRKEDT